MSGPHPEVFSDEFYQDPYPVFSWLREHAPVYTFRGAFGNSPMWIVTRYSDVRALLADERFSTSMSVASDEFRQASAGGWVGTEMAESMLGKDPPDHTRIRRLAAKPFTVRRVAEWRDETIRIVESLLEVMASVGQVELMEEYASVIPARMLSQILGIPADLRDLVIEQTELALSFDPRSGQAARAICSIGRELIAERRRRPSDDLLSDLIAARDEHGKLSEIELVAIFTLLLGAGFDTTRSVIGNAVLALVDHPDQRTLLIEDPDIVPSAIEELLRFDGPFLTGTLRFPHKSLEFAGVELPAGAPVIPALSAANRDPARFEAPDQLNLTRADNAHLALGHGVHFCLGAALGRLQAQVAIPLLLRRFPTLGLACPRESIEHRASYIARSVVSLPVVLN